MRVDLAKVDLVPIFLKLTHEVYMQVHESRLIEQFKNTRCDFYCTIKIMPSCFYWPLEKGCQLYYSNFVPSFQPQLLHPQAKVEWKRCADMPVKMILAQAVKLGEKIYTGGGLTENDEDGYQVFQYDISRDEWSCLPPCQVRLFGMDQFAGNLITVGGKTHAGVTGKVYCFKEGSAKWEEFLKPMPTVRCSPSVATTQSSIVGGGLTENDEDGHQVLYNMSGAVSLPAKCDSLPWISLRDILWEI